jgi:hypothetical protein
VRRRGYRHFPPGIDCWRRWMRGCPRAQGTRWDSIGWCG